MNQETESSTLKNMQYVQQILFWNWYKNAANIKNLDHKCNLSCTSLINCYTSSFFLKPIIDWSNGIYT